MHLKETAAYWDAAVSLIEWRGGNTSKNNNETATASVWVNILEMLKEGRSSRDIAATISCRSSIGCWRVSVVAFKWSDGRRMEIYYSESHSNKLLPGAPSATKWQNRGGRMKTWRYYRLRLMKIECNKFIDFFSSFLLWSRREYC